jgi:hypothetical protein
MKAYDGVDVQIHILLTSALVACEWSASRLGRFTPGKEPVCHWMEYLVEPTAGVDDVVKRKFLTPTGTRTRTLGRVIRKAVAISTTLSRLPYFN